MESKLVNHGITKPTNLNRKSSGLNASSVLVNAKPSAKQLEDAP